MLHYRAVARTNTQKLSDIILGTFGAVVMVYTTALTVQSWVRGSTATSPGYCDE